MRLFLIVALTACAALLVRAHVAEGIYIASESMEPTLKKDAFFFVDKLSYGFREPERLEIVVFEPPVAEDKEFVKRIVGLPGDTIEIRDKQVYINDTPEKAEYAVYKRKNEVLQGDNLGPLKVPAGSYFLMGDNRDESRDSRDFVGPDGSHIYFIERSRIRGRLMKIF